MAKNQLVADDSSQWIKLWIGLSLLAVLASLVILYTTKWGAGLIDWDSYNYISGARNLAHGLGLVISVDNQTTAPLTHYPPLLSILLAAFEFIGIDALAGIRWLNAVLFGLNGAIFGYTLYTVRHSIPFAWFGALLFSASNVFILAHSLALSEPLLLFFTLTGFLCLGRYFENQRMASLVASIILLGLGCLTKYVGMAGVLAAALVLVIVEKPFNLRNLTKGFVFGTICILPLLAWTILGAFSTHTINNRSLGWYPLTTNNFVQAFRTVIDIFIPDQIILGYEKWIFYALILIFVALIFYGYQQRGRLSFDFQGKSIVFVYGIFIILYAGFVFASKTFFDPQIGMTSRMFSPILQALILVSVIGLAALWDSKRRVLRAAVLVFSLYWLSCTAVLGVNQAFLLHENGYGLARKSINTSDAVAQLKILAKSEDVYSNNPYFLYLLSGRPGYRINTIPVYQKASPKIAAFFKKQIGAAEFQAEKYADQLQIIADDQIVTVYRFNPEDK